MGVGVELNSPNPSSDAPGCRPSAWLLERDSRPSAAEEEAEEEAEEAEEEKEGPPPALRFRPSAVPALSVLRRCEPPRELIAAVRAVVVVCFSAASKS